MGAKGTIAPSPDFGRNLSKMFYFNSPWITTYFSNGILPGFLDLPTALASLCAMPILEMAIGTELLPIELDKTNEGICNSK